MYPAFSATELAIVDEAKSILNSPEFRRIRDAHTAQGSTTVVFGNRTVQYEHGLPASGMTMFGLDGFLIGREAFASEEELVKTLLHELHRLHTSKIGAGDPADKAAIARETEMAFEFAERAYPAFFGA